MDADHQVLLCWLSPTFLQLVKEDEFPPNDALQTILPDYVLTENDADLTGMDTSATAKYAMAFCCVFLVLDAVIFHTCSFQAKYWAESAWLENAARQSSHPSISYLCGDLERIFYIFSKFAVWLSSNRKVILQWTFELTFWWSSFLSVRMGRY